ncbi:MAG: MBL fold metallo-hydrolase [Anaerolineales bacterium]|nr:MBL fold metallo-hydrolase [Anaerolineales bacterium]
MKQIAPSIYVETEYEGVNVGAIFTDKGIICIDAPSYPQDARHWAAELRKRSSVPIRYVILTDCHGDRVINARWLNGPIVMHQMAAKKLRTYERRYPQALLDSLIKRNPVYGRELSHYPVSRPTITFTEELQLCVGEQRLKLLHAPGPSAGNLWVYLEQEQILFTGDAVVVNTHPRLVDADYDCWLQSLEQRLNSLQITTLVPGRGAVSDKKVAQSVIDYVKSSQIYVMECVNNQLPQTRLQKYGEQLLSMFPLSCSEVWLQEQILTGLTQLYNKSCCSTIQKVA